MLRSQFLKEVESDSKPTVTLEKGNRQEKYRVSIFDKNVIFIEMDKLHRWIARKDIAWAKQVRVGGFFNLELMHIPPLVKEFIQGIVQANMDVIDSIIQGVPILIIENMVTKML